MPTVKNSKLPGLLGLNSLRSRRAVIDCHTRKMYFLGPGDYDLAAGMPTGTQTFQLETAPSGHLVLPISHFKEVDEKQKHGNLTLDAVPLSLPVNVSGANPYGPARGSAQSAKTDPYGGPLSSSSSSSTQ